MLLVLLLSFAVAVVVVIVLAFIYSFIHLFICSFIHLFIILSSQWAAANAMSPNEVTSPLHRLSLLLSDKVAEHYKALQAMQRKKQQRVTRALPLRVSLPLTARHAFKTAFYAECARDVRTARKYFTDAHAAVTALQVRI